MKAELRTTLTLSGEEMAVAIWTYLKNRGVAVPPAPENITVIHNDCGLIDVEVSFGATETINLVSK